MNTLYQKLQQATSARASREELAQFVAQNLNLMPELFGIATDFKDKIHHKAAWIIDILSVSNPELFQKLMPEFCAVLPFIPDEESLRPFARAAWMLVSQSEFSITHEQKSMVAEACFDWLIAERKVATKMYAIRTLYFLGKAPEFPEIHETLKTIISEDAHKHSYAYQAVAREILQKMKKYNLKLK